MHAGKYWGKDNKVITSPNLFGSIDGDPKLNWVMTDGFEAFHLIPQFSPSDAPPGASSSHGTCTVHEWYGVNSAPTSAVQCITHFAHRPPFIRKHDSPLSMHSRTDPPHMHMSMLMM
jgi:hypothetical protein